MNCKKKFSVKAIIIMIILVLIVGTVSTNNNIASSGDSNQGYQEEIFNDADRLFKKYNLQGASVALIKNGKIVDIKNYGMANVEKQVPVTNNTEFKIASISKTVTAYGIMQLVNEGKLNLDVPISEYLTKWNLPESEFDNDKVTLRRIMSHTAGITDSTELGYDEKLPTIDKALYDRDIKLKREPGTQFEYSSFAGYGICQLIIEECTGMKFEDYMQKAVFNPLNMENSKYNEYDLKNPKSMATPYAGIRKPIKTAPIVMNGAGGLNTTSTDLARFVIGLINFYNDGNLEMFTQQKGTESNYGVYGLGIIPCKLKNGMTIMEHNGTLTGWNAQIAFEPESKNGIVVLTNSDKAYYFTYDLMGKWSNRVAGDIVPNSESAYKVENIVKAIIIFLMIILITMLVSMSKKIIDKDIIICTKKKEIIKSFLKSLPILLFGVLWYVFFYTDIPFKIFFSMQEYYIFTFITPNFYTVSKLVCGMIFISILRMFFIKNSFKN